MSASQLLEQPRQPFFDVPQSSHDTPAGAVELPILYRDASIVMAFFGAPVDAARALLADTGLAPAGRLGRRTLVGLVFFEYRDTSIGPYNEVGLALPVLPAGYGRSSLVTDFLRAPENRRLGYRILDLPVTTEIACAAGRTLWGYPKFVTDIDFEYRDRRLAMRVADPDGEDDILRLEGRLPPGPPLPAPDLLLYSDRDGTRLRTHVTVDATARVSTGRGTRLSVGGGDHPMARRLRRLELDGRTPLLVAATDRFRSRLPAGRATASG